MIRTVFICCCLPPLIFAHVIPAFAQSQSAIEREKTKAYTAFAQGKLNESVAILKTLIPTAPNRLAAADLERDIIEICITGYLPCYYEANQKLWAAIQADKTLSRLYPELMLYDIRERIWASDDKFVQQIIQNGGPASYANPYLFPGTFAEMQLAMHAYYVRKGDLRSAEHTISAAIIGLLTMPHSRRYTASKILAGIFEALVEEQDIVGAFQFLKIIDPYISKNLSHQNPLYAEYLLNVGQVFSYTRLNSITTKTLADAAKLYQQSEILPYIKSFELAVANSLGSAALALDGKLGEAKALHAQHPMQSQRLQIFSRGTFQNIQEFYFAISDVFLSAAENVKPDIRWKPLFEKEPVWAANDFLRPVIDAYRNFSLASIELFQGNRQKATQLFIDAAKLRLKVFERTQSGSSEGFELPGLVDKLVIGVALKFAATSNSSDTTNLMLQASEVLFRNLRYSISDETVLLASQPDQTSRRHARAYINLVQQKRDWELKHIREWLNSSTSFNREVLVQEYNSVVTTLSKLKSELTKHSDFAASIKLPTVSEIQTVLSKRDIYITYFPTLAGFGRLCIDKTHATYSLGTFDKTAARDARILELAVTNTNAPNAQLDSQYPVYAALHLRNILFDGLNECMKPGSQIAMSLPLELTNIPVAALLQYAPPRKGDGYDLKNAHWLIRDYSLSFVVSARQFIADKRRVPELQAPLQYLGIGDPRLNKENISSLASAFSLRQNLRLKKGALEGLGELPDTADELRKVAMNFDKDKRVVLLGNGATEEAFRAQPLEDYDVLHFATHGAFDDGSTTFSESALILTPGPSASDGFNDGILSASEISLLSLRARLVVLSACNTGRYNQKQANTGFHDLQAAFTVAGTPTILATLWSIDSSTSTNLITHFFGFWRSGQYGGAARALSQTIRNYLNHADISHQHPRFWAPFEILGNGSIKGLSDRKIATPNNFRPLHGFNAGGEILSGVPQDGNIVLSMLGDWDGKRMAGIIRKQDLRGRVLWSVTSREIGAGDLIVAPNQLYASGYRWNGHSIPVLRSFDSSGKLLWEKDFPNLSDYNFSSIAHSRTGIYVLAYPYLRNSKDSPAYLLSFDPSGAVLKKVSIQIGTINLTGRAATLGVINDRVFVAINKDTTMKFDLKKRNILGFPSACFENGLVNLYEFDANDFSLRHKIPIQNFRVAALNVWRDHLYVGGEALDGCAPNGHAAVLKMEADGSIHRFWQDDGVFVSSVHAITATDELQIIVDYERAVAINVVKKIDPTTYVYNKRFGDDNMVIREGAIISLSQNGKVRARKDFSTGLSIILSGAVRVGNELFAYGSLGGDPAISLH